MENLEQQPGGAPQVQPQNTPQMQSAPVPQDEQTYGGFIKDPVEDTPMVDKINAPTMRWTKAGPVIIVALTFLGIVMMSKSLFFPILLGLAGFGVMVCMILRLANAMDAHKMWYPKKLLIVTGVAYLLSIIMGDVSTLMSRSMVVNAIGAIVAMAAGVCMCLTGKQFKSSYSGKLGRFGTAMLVIGVIVVLGGVINLYNSRVDASSVAYVSTSNMLGHIDSLYMLFLAIPFCLVYYAMLWPLRILARTMSTYDAPTTAEADDDYSEHSSSTAIWVWTIVFIILAFLAKVLIKLSHFNSSEVYPG